MQAEEDYTPKLHNEDIPCDSNTDYECDEDEDWTDEDDDELLLNWLKRSGHGGI